ncbi:deoxyribodipyrimidine photolyase, partial [Tenacibaculum discolor]
FRQMREHGTKGGTKNFKQKYNEGPWRKNEEELKKWWEGKTGNQMVDEGMRELNETGDRQKRVRRRTAGWLWKHLVMEGLL